MNISIIVPIYNIQENYLRQCIESLINQTMQSIEIILIDDGTPDNGGGVCDEYSQKDHRIVVIHKENEGVSIARNIGIKVAKGQYIMFVDADDILEKNTCEVIYESFSKSKSDFLVFKYALSKQLYYNTRKIECITDRNKYKQYQLSVIDSKYHIDNMEYLIGSPWAKLFSKDFLINNNIEFVPHLKKAQDRVFMLHCLEFCENIMFLDYTGYFYNEHPDSVCRNYNPNIGIITNKLVDVVGGFIRKYHCRENEYEQAYKSMKINLLYENIYLYYFHIKSDISFSNKYKFMNELVKQEQFQENLKSIDFCKWSGSERIVLYLWKVKFTLLSTMFLEFKRKIKIKTQNNY